MDLRLDRRWSDVHFRASRRGARVATQASPGGIARLSAWHGATPLIIATLLAPLLGYVAGWFADWTAMAARIHPDTGLPNVVEVAVAVVSAA